MTNSATNAMIRPLEMSDIDVVQSIDKDQHGEAWSHRTFVDEINLDSRVHLVAEQAGAVVGHASAWIDEGCCRITNVAVAAGSVGFGHGSTLLVSLLDTVLERHRVAYAQLEVRPSNRRAQRLYGQFGFIPVGIERNFYDHTDDCGSRDAVVMAVPDVCSGAWRDRLAKLRSDLTVINLAASNPSSSDRLIHDLSTRDRNRAAI